MDQRLKNEPQATLGAREKAEKADGDKPEADRETSLAQAAPEKKGLYIWIERARVSAESLFKTSFATYEDFPNQWRGF